MGGHKWGRGIAVGAIAGAAIGLVPFVASGAQAAPIIVTIASSTQFDTEVLKRSEERLMVAFFTTSWCSKCKKIDPTARDMAKKADGRWGLAIVDADDNEALADKYNVAALPTFLFLCQRQVHSRLVDEASPTVLQQQITKEESWCSKAVQPIGGETTTAKTTPTPTPTSKVLPVSTPTPASEVTPAPTPTPVPEVTPAPSPEPGPGTLVPIDPWWFG